MTRLNSDFALRWDTTINMQEMLKIMSPLLCAKKSDRRGSVPLHFKRCRLMFFVCLHFLLLYQSWEFLWVSEKESIEKLCWENEHLVSKLGNLEYHSWRANLVLFSIPEMEKDDYCRTYMKDIFENFVGVDQAAVNQIESCHRTLTFCRPDFQDKLRIIIWSFLFVTRESVRKLCVEKFTARRILREQDF